MNDPAQQARMKHVLHQYTEEWGSGVQARQRQTESINDVPPLYLDDGTWVIKYSVQAPDTVGFRDQNYNRKMLNCMECGVPVGVIFATEVGYKVLGLAFVERFEPENGWFGPNTVFLEAHRIEFDHSEKKREKAGLLPYWRIWLWRSFKIVLFDRIAWQCNLTRTCWCMLFLV